MSGAAKSVWCAQALLAVTLLARGGALVGTVIGETAASGVFQSEFAGRLTPV